MPKTDSLRVLMENGSTDSSRYCFDEHLLKEGLTLPPSTIETLQVNITKLCNQACLHCHVDAGPKRKEAMSRDHLERCLELLSQHKELKNLDITGGAPELHPDFDWFVVEAKKRGAHVMSRHNLTVTIDGHPVSGASKRYLPDFYADNQVEVISSLPCYTEEYTDRQRGTGVFEKSIESLQMLNARGFGKEESNLRLNLVYNPVGAILPGDQRDLELQYKKHLGEQYGIHFNELLVITNMPIKRFRTQLEREGSLQSYMNTLVDAFNPLAAQGVMCRNLISIAHDGTIYDCDFNQMLELPIKECTLDTFDFDLIKNRSIIFDSHCFGCTAGAGSSCGGQVA